MNKPIGLFLLLCTLFFCGTEPLRAQTYVKLNGLYILAGVVNPSVEFPLSRKFSFNSEFVLSPWKSLGGKPFLFGIAMIEGRWHVKEVYKGWYFAGSVGFQVNKIQKDDDKYSRGMGHIYGISAGHQWLLNERWMIEAFGGIGFQNTWYRGYDVHTHELITELNQSAEYLPYKVGFSIGYKICNPEKRKKRRK